MALYIDYFYIIGTIFFTVYGQVILKYRITNFGPLPTQSFEKVKFLLTLLIDPLIFSGFFAAFLAALLWMAAMTKFQLSHAYPFMSLNFAIVLILSRIFMNEPMNTLKVLGVLLIVLGTTIASRG